MDSNPTQLHSWLYVTSLRLLHEGYTIEVDTYVDVCVRGHNKSSSLFPSRHVDRELWLQCSFEPAGGAATQ